MRCLLEIVAFLVAFVALYARADRGPPTLVMYETRDLGDVTTYWRAAYDLAANYAERHGHNFVMYTLPKGVARLEACDGSNLGLSWGKAAAAVQATLDFPDSRFFLFLDSDAAISTESGKTGESWADRSLAHVLAAAVGWPGKMRKPVLVNQASRDYWLHRAPQNKTRWRYLLNSGTFAWRGPQGRSFVEDFWRKAASDEIRGVNPLGLDFSHAWPQDQYGLNAVANSQTWVDLLEAAPQKHAYAADMGAYHDGVGRKHRAPWPCLSGLPRFRCVIDHYCMYGEHKRKLVGVAKRRGLLDANTTTFQYLRELPGLDGVGTFRDACVRPDSSWAFSLF